MMDFEETEDAAVMSLGSADIISPDLWDATTGAAHDLTPPVDSTTPEESPPEARSSHKRSQRLSLHLAAQL